MSRPMRSGKAALPSFALGAVLAAAAGLVGTGCGGGGGGGGVPIADSAGTGTRTLAVRALVEARDVLVASSTLYTTDFTVEVWSDAGRALPVSGATVSVTDASGAVTSLKEDLPGGPGTYVARILGYPQSFIVRVNAGAMGSLDASIVGPPIHGITLSQAQPIAVNAATTVTWSPSGETRCGGTPSCVEIGYRGLIVGPAPLPTPDDGSYTFPTKGIAPANFLDTEPGRTDEERIEITRFKRIDIDSDDAPPGGAIAGSGSFVELSVRARTASLNTADTRLNSIAGTVDDPPAGPCANPAGNVVVAAWPDANPDPIDVASALGSATVLDASYGGPAPDFPDPFTLMNLEPTSGVTLYNVRAWVDSDGDGRLDPGECFGDFFGASLAPSPDAATDVGLLLLDTVF